MLALTAVRSGFAEQRGGLEPKRGGKMERWRNGGGGADAKGDNVALWKLEWSSRQRLYPDIRTA